MSADRVNPNRPLRRGHQLGPYEIVRLVAEGGTSARVYEAVDAAGERYAVKVLPTSTDLEPSLVTRFEREAAVLGKLEHPNVPRLLDQGVAGRLRYLVFRFFDHETLGETIARRGRLPVSEVVDLLRACGSALAVVHELGILHRDVKPSNILVLRDGSIKLIDFGLVLVADSSQLTHSDEVVGTYGYIAPEALMGDKEGLSGKADMYSLGCVAFEALTGRPPFTDRNLTTLIMAHMEREPPDARSLLPETPGGLADLLERLLRKDPEQRPDTAELLRRLDALAA